MTDRKKFWTDLVLAYTSASSSTQPEKAIEWADKCMEAYERRYLNNCNACHGKGFYADKDLRIKQCHNCTGSGKVSKNEHECTKCHGKGIMKTVTGPYQICYFCQGDGIDPAD